MIDVKIKDSDIRTAVGEGMDSFVQVFIDAINNMHREFKADWLKVAKRLE